MQTYDGVMPFLFVVATLLYRACSDITQAVTQPDLYAHTVWVTVVRAVLKLLTSGKLAASGVQLALI